MPVNPDTGLYNVTHAEVEAARVHQLGLTFVTLVREDGTLTDWGQMFVAKERRARVESEEDYVRACDAMHAANPSRLEGEL